MLGSIQLSLVVLRRFFMLIFRDSCIKDSLRTTVYYKLDCPNLLTR